MNWFRQNVHMLHDCGHVLWPAFGIKIQITMSLFG